MSWDLLWYRPVCGHVHEGARRCLTPIKFIQFPRGKAGTTLGSYKVEGVSACTGPANAKKSREGKVLPAHQNPALSSGPTLLSLFLLAPHSRST